MTDAPALLDRSTPPSSDDGASDAGHGLLAQVTAEAFGTFALVLAGVGVALWAGVGGVGAGVLGVALAFGIAVIGAATVVGHVSGGHFNPAVTLGAAIAGRTPWRNVLPFWLAQVIGGALATAILFIVSASLPVLETFEGGVRGYFSGASNGYAEHSPIAAQAGEGFGLFGAVIIEIVVTAVFVTVILGATRAPKPSPVTPVVIGLTLAAMILVAAPVTNASVNPARSTATALFSESWALTQLWAFWVAPLIGAAIAGAVAFVLFPPSTPDTTDLLTIDVEEPLADALGAGNLPAVTLEEVAADATVVGDATADEDSAGR